MSIRLRHVNLKVIYYNSNLYVCLNIQTLYPVIDQPETMINGMNYILKLAILSLVRHLVFCETFS